MERIILALIFVFVLYKYLTRTFSYWKKKQVPYVKPYPLVGNFFDVLTLRKTFGHYFADLYSNRKDPFFGIFVFDTPYLVVKDPDLVKSILVKDFNYFYDRTIACDEKADGIMANLIFSMKNPDWKVVRSKLTPIFTSGKLKAMLPLMNKAADDMRTHLEKVNGTVVEAKELCAKFTTDLLTSCAFGINAHSFDRENAEFRVMGRKMFDFQFLKSLRVMSYFFFPKIVSTFKISFFEPDVNKFVRRAFWGAIKKREMDGNKRNDLIDLIIEMKRDEKFGENFNFGKNFLKYYFFNYFPHLDLNDKLMV